MAASTNGEIPQLRSRFPLFLLMAFGSSNSWGGAVENVAVRVFIGVNEEGHREILGVYEGGKEDHASWLEIISSTQTTRSRSLSGIELHGVRSPLLVCFSAKTLGLVHQAVGFSPKNSLEIGFAGLGNLSRTGS